MAKISSAIINPPVEQKHADLEALDYSAGTKLTLLRAFSGEARYKHARATVPAPGVVEAVFGDSADQYMKVGLNAAELQCVRDAVSGLVNDGDRAIFNAVSQAIEEHANWSAYLVSPENKPVEVIRRERAAADAAAAKRRAEGEAKIRMRGPAGSR